MSNREDVQIIEFIPDNLREDSEVSTISEVLQPQFDTVAEALPGIQIYKNIDLLPEPILRMLAVENRVYKYEWQLAQTIEAKRDLVKNSFELNQRRGTTWSVERVFSLLGINASLQEWWEYGGSPYQFKIDLFDTTGRTINAETQSTLARLVDYYKPLRSSYMLTVGIQGEGILGFQGSVRFVNHRRLLTREGPYMGGLGLQSSVRAVNYRRLDSVEDAPAFLASNDGGYLMAGDGVRILI